MQIALFAPEWLVRQDVFARPRDVPNCSACDDTGSRPTVAGTTIHCHCAIGDIKRRRGLRSRSMTTIFDGGSHAALP
jgi:hypothetical protein